VIAHFLEGNWFREFLGPYKGKAIPILIDRIFFYSKKVWNGISEFKEGNL